MKDDYYGILERVFVLQLLQGLIECKRGLDNYPWYAGNASAFSANANVSPDETVLEVVGAPTVVRILTLE